MKPFGTPDNEDEVRAERALACFPDLPLRNLTYRVALPAVALPPYHAVESITFDIAPDGTEPTLFLKMAGDETNELVDDTISFTVATRLEELALVAGGKNRRSHARSSCVATDQDAKGNRWRSTTRFPIS